MKTVTRIKANRHFLEFGNASRRLDSVFCFNGTQEWYDDWERLHREGDLPALVYSNGKHYWYKHGQCYR